MNVATNPAKIAVPAIAATGSAFSLGRAWLFGSQKAPKATGSSTIVLVVGAAAVVTGAWFINRRRKTLLRCFARSSVREFIEESIDDLPNEEMKMNQSYIDFWVDHFLPARYDANHKIRHRARNRLARSVPVIREMCSMLRSSAIEYSRSDADWKDLLFKAGRVVDDWIKDAMDDVDPGDAGAVRARQQQVDDVKRKKNFYQRAAASFYFVRTDDDDMFDEIDHFVAGGQAAI